MGDIPCPQGPVRVRRLRRHAWAHPGSSRPTSHRLKAAGSGWSEKRTRRTGRFCSIRTGATVHRQRSPRAGLAGHEFRPMSVANDSGSVVEPCRYAFRSFDRQWIIPDKRLINQPNPTLWSTHSDRQIYLTAPEDRTPTAGPAASFSDLIPDLHHYHGRGGRVFPLWRDAGGKHPNIKPAFLTHLTERYGVVVSAEDVMSYLAGVLAHSEFTERFSQDLKQPGLRVPVTADPKLFAETTALGREIVWLHCYGERMAHEGMGRPTGPPRLGKSDAPHHPQGRAPCPERRIRCQKPSDTMP